MFEFYQVCLGPSIIRTDVLFNRILICSFPDFAASRNLSFYIYPYDNAANDLED